MPDREALDEHIRSLVAGLPREVVNRVAGAMEADGPVHEPHFRSRVMQAIPQADLRARVGTFIDFWRKQARSVPPSGVALALRAAAAVEAHHRRQQRIEPVWTGPAAGEIPLRRTDQALLQLINEAEQRLHIVSFAIYKMDAITDALVEAARRGVAVAIYLETQEDSAGKITYDTIRALGEEIARHADLYVWPLEQCERSPDGRHGSLHAKVAVADGRAMLVSSANLTEYAMSLNIELGLMVYGGELSGLVEKALLRLVEHGVFQLVRQV